MLNTVSIVAVLLRSKGDCGLHFFYQNAVVVHLAYCDSCAHSAWSLVAARICEMQKNAIVMHTRTHT